METDVCRKVCFEIFFVFAGRVVDCTAIVQQLAGWRKAERVAELRPLFEQRSTDGRPWHGRPVDFVS